MNLFRFGAFFIFIFIFSFSMYSQISFQVKLLEKESIILSSTEKTKDSITINLIEIIEDSMYHQWVQVGAVKELVSIQNYEGIKYLLENIDVEYYDMLDNDVEAISYAIRTRCPLDLRLSTFLRLLSEEDLLPEQVLKYNIFLKYSTTMPLDLINIILKSELNIAVTSSIYHKNLLLIIESLKL
jgi:hypothetical protein